MSYLLISYHIQEIGSDGLSKLNIGDELRDEHLRDLKQDLKVKEVFQLSTCNRSEYLFHTEDLEKLLSRLNKSNKLPLDSAKFYSSSESVIQHLLEVALSMDSLIFGENQILGQLKTAYRQALKEENIGPRLSALLQEVLKHAKKIRSLTRLRNIHSSVATVSARKFLDDYMDAKTVLFVGAGETNQLAARYLKKHSKVNFIWTNRTDSKAESAAKEIGGKSMLWNDFLSANLSPVDAVFLATNAGGHIFEHGQMKASCPKCIYDLSIPNNADKKLSEQMSIQYVDVDELGNILKREQERFEELKSELRDKIQNSKNEIMEFIDQKKLDPVITESLENIDLLLSSAFQKLPKELDGLNEEQRVALKLWSRSLMKKTKHEHIKQLRKLKQEEKRKK